MLDERDIGFDQAGLDFVVLQAGARIEGPDVIDGLLNRIGRTADRFGNFFVLLALDRAQVLVADGDGILQNLRGTVAGFFCGLVSVFALRKLLLVIAQLAEKTLAQVAAADTRRVKLTHNFESFLQIGSREVRLIGWTRRGGRGLGSGSNGRSGVSIARGKGSFGERRWRHAR